VVFFKRADVAAFAADDPALHRVVGDAHAADGVIRGLFGGVALDRLDDDLLALLLGFILRLFGDLLDDGPRLAAALVFDAAQQHFLACSGVMFVSCNSFSALLAKHIVQLLLLACEHFFALGEAYFVVVDVLFFDAQRIQLAIENIFALGQFLFEILELGRARGRFLSRHLRAA